MDRVQFRIVACTVESFAGAWAILRRCHDRPLATEFPLSSAREFVTTVVPFLDARDALYHFEWLDWKGPAMPVEGRILMEINIVVSADDAALLILFFPEIAPRLILPPT